MRISNKKNFIFLANPKSGSTSIRKILDEYSDIKSSQTFPFYHHTSAIELKTYFESKGWNWDNYTIFSTIRNPWDRAISNYFYAKPDKNFLPWYSINYDKKTAFHHSLNNWVQYVLTHSFYEERNYCFNEKFSKSPYILRALHLMVPIKWFCSYKNEFLVDKVFKTEDIDNQLPLFLKSLEINIDKIPTLNQNKKELNQQLNGKSIETIYNLFKEEISFYNFTY